jgi:hypothetical protein
MVWRPTDREPPTPPIRKQNGPADQASPFAGQPNAQRSRSCHGRAREPFRLVFAFSNIFELPVPVPAPVLTDAWHGDQHGHAHLRGGER